MTERINDLHKVIEHRSVEDQIMNDSVMSLKAIAQSAQNDIEQVQGDVSRLRTILSDMDNIEKIF